MANLDSAAPPSSDAGLHAGAVDPATDDLGALAATLAAGIEQATCDADCVIIVPPFSDVTLPALGPHLLQAAAEARGMRVRILYASLIFAALVGLDAYQGICEDRTDAQVEGRAQGPQFPGERVFARLAHGVDGLTAARSRVSAGTPLPILAGAERLTDLFCTLVAEGLATSGCRIVGLTSSFQQTNASFALLRAIKAARPDTVTLLGGANCEACMGAELLRQGEGVLDHVFSGESDHTFPRALERLLAGVRPLEPLIAGEPVFTLDDSPPPDFRDYFAQLASFVPEFDLKLSWLTYETSRGCWWGQKHHCTFCGLNGQTMAFREKSTAKVVAELKALSAGAPTTRVAMADNIMPHRYHATLVPALKAAELPLSIFYEQKANLSLDQVKALGDAGVRSIQPGIEALATPSAQADPQGRVRGPEHLAPALRTSPGDLRRLEHPMRHPGRRRSGLRIHAEDHAAYPASQPADRRVPHQYRPVQSLFRSERGLRH